MAINSVDDVFEVAPTAGGRATNAIIEVKDMLKKWMPQVIDKVRDDVGISIPKPKGYYLAGTEIKGDWPNVVVGFSVQCSPMAGLGRVDQDHVSIVAYYAYHRIESEVQLLNCLDGCYWIRNIISCNRGYHCNADGLPCWKGLEPEGIVPSPQGFPHFQGMAYQCRVWQPGDKMQGRSWWSIG